MGERQYRDFATGEYGYSEFNCYDAYTGELVWSAPFENGPPSNEQCNAYGNLYLAPTKPGNRQSGVYNYTSTGAEWTLDEIWCIGGKTADWSMFLNDPQHSAEGDGPTKLQLDWVFKTGGPVVSSATCVDGVIYFGSSSADHKIYAVDAKTGVQKWTFETEFAIYSSVAVVNGRVYTGTDDGNVYCLDAATGNKLWKTPAGGITNSVLSGGLGFSQVRSSPVVLNNRVYVGSLDGNLYCLDAIGGSVMWKFKGVEPCVIFATPTIYNNSIYLPSTRGGYRVGSGPSVTRGDFYKLDLNGNTIWHIEVPYVLNQSAGAGNWFFASPTVAPNLGIVILRNGLRLTHAFNMTDGKAIWTRDGRYNIGTPVQFGGPPLTDAAIYKYGQLYMNDYYGIVCLNARDGSEVWYTYTSREMNTQGFSYSFNRLYVVNEQGFLFVLDATTGEKLSGYDGWGSLQLHSAPVPYDGKLYVGAPDWNMYCFKEAAPAPEQTPTPTAEPLTADIIAQKVLNSLPAYPAVPSASEIAQLIAS